MLNVSTETIVDTERTADNCYSSDTSQLNSTTNSRELSESYDSPTDTSDPSVTATSCTWSTRFRNWHHRRTMLDPYVEWAKSHFPVTLLLCSRKISSVLSSLSSILTTFSTFVLSLIFLPYSSQLLRCMHFVESLAGSILSIVYGRRIPSDHSFCILYLSGQTMTHRLNLKNILTRNEQLSQIHSHSEYGVFIRSLVDHWW